MTKILLNPLHMRLTAAVADVTANDFRQSSLRLKGAHLPELPPSCAAEVASGLRRGAHELELLAYQLERQAQELKRRAARVELDLATLSPSYCLRRPRFEPAKKESKSIWGRILDVAFRDDIRTLRDSKSSFWAKALAGASLVPLPIGRGVKVGGLGVKRVSRLGKRADDLKHVRPPEVKRVGPRWPINSRYAGKPFPLPPELAKKYPGGVRFNRAGFPDLSPYRRVEVKIILTGNRRRDIREANRIAGYRKTPPGYTWHHVEDTKTLQLVPADLHKAVSHTGGYAVDKHQRLTQGIRRAQDLHDLDDTLSGQARSSPGHSRRPPK